jgi:hypothetical protein
MVTGSTAIEFAARAVLGIDAYSVGNLAGYALQGAL